MTRSVLYLMAPCCLLAAAVAGACDAGSSTEFAPPAGASGGLASSSAGGSANGGGIASGGVSPSSGGAQVAGGQTAGAGSPTNATGGANSNTPSGGSPPAGGAASGTGGSAQAGGGSAPVGTGDQPFELLWEDTFDTIDMTRWQLMTHSWDTNLAQFTAENATTSDGILRLALTASGDATKPYKGVEMRSRETLRYGRIEASARFAAGSAVVSSLVLIYTPWPPDDWNELDIEFLGSKRNRIQFNHMVNIPPADPATGHLQFPQLANLNFDPSEAFHTYVIEWEPTEARFFIDGQLLHTATKEMARMVLPQNILLTIWASNSAAWAGPVDGTTAPTAVEYDWLRVYKYVER